MCLPWAHTWVRPYVLLSPVKSDSRSPGEHHLLGKALISALVPLSAQNP